MDDLTYGEPWSQDQMNRKGVAKFLTGYLDATPKIKVLNVNSAWGSGKTFFLKNWVAEQSSERACVYFNAWETDFSGDAFVALVSAIKEQLHEVIGPLQDAENIIRSFTNKASKTLIAATPALAKGVIKKFTGVDVGLLSGIVDEDAIADAAEKAVEKLIETNKETLAVVKDFKKVFHELIILSSHQRALGSEAKPVYIFIDELDRCRPIFAIELLERIKHLFEVKDCKFIIATDTQQLGHSIKAIYGSSFSSEKYLKRFFDAEFTLDNSDLSAWVKTNCSDFDDSVIGLGNYVKPASGRNIFDSEEIVRPDEKAVLEGAHQLNQYQVSILALALTFKSKLRELEKILMQINAVRTNCKTSGGFHFFWASYLVFLKDDAPDLYDMATKGNAYNAMQEIKKRYEGQILYFGTSNDSIHDVFVNYLNLYRGGKEAARKLMHGEGNRHDYINRLTRDFYSEYDAMKGYVALVDLAHRID
jgi:hypothetical protein